MISTASKFALKNSNKILILHIESEFLHELLVKVGRNGELCTSCHRLHEWRIVQHFDVLYMQLSDAALNINY